MPTSKTFNQTGNTVIYVMLAVIIALLVLIMYLVIGKQPTSGISPTKMMGGTCDYNGVTYKAGEGFPADDGCNSCSCGENGQVACTLMACEDIKDIERPIMYDETVQSSPEAE